MKNILDKSLTVFIRPCTQAFFARAEEIALKIGGTVTIEDNIQNSDNNIIIFINTQGISIGKSGNNQEKPVFIDFSSNKMQYRKKNSGVKKEALARAVGLKSNNPLNILDATAGLGGDSFILASLGANMLMLERNSLIYLLLEDAILRARNDESLKDTMQRMNLIAEDAIAYLDDITSRPDVIYMDPMFPEKSKTAKSKKEMHLFREIAGADDDINTLFIKAMENAKSRVVIKRPRKSLYVKNIKPHFSITGKSSRFDVYMK